MFKSILSIALAAVITSGIPVANIDAMDAKKLNDYTENNIKYTAFATSDGNMWITEGKYKKGKDGMIFDNKSTKSVYDDEIIKIIKIK